MRRIGTYQLEEEIARGGMGVVYRARDPKLARDVALKLLQSHPDDDERWRQRFGREVEALGKLHHPGLVTVHAAGEHEGAPYLVMELLQGETLQARLARGPLEVRQAAEDALALAEALEHAHQAGVLHRDLKPSNVILCGRGPVLTDFGLAKHVDALGESQRLSATGQFLGTPGYWSPEQAFGERGQVDARSDVYGLGATLYAMLTGRPPCVGESLVAALQAVEEPVVPPGKLRAGVDPRLEAICLRCLAKSPAQRYPSAAALADDLRDYLAEGSPAAAGATRWLALGLVLGGLLLSGAIVAMQRAGSPAPVSPQVEQVDPAEAAAWDRARELEARGDLAGARAALDEVVRISPRRVDALVWRARLSSLLQDFEKALSDGEIAVRLAPDSLAAQLQAARAWHGVHAQWDVSNRLAAIARVDSLLQAGLDTAEAHRVRAYMAIHNGDVETGLRELELAYERDPDDPQVLLDRAGCHFYRQELPAAIADCERALELQPENLEGWLKLGSYAGSAGDLQRAEQVLLEACRRFPEAEGAHGNLAAIRFAQERYREALDGYRQACALKGQTSARDLRQIANCLAGLGQLEEARREYARAIQLHEAWVEGAYDRRLRASEQDVYWRLAWVELQLGRLEQAEQALERARQVLGSESPHEEALGFLAGELARRR